MTQLNLQQHKYKLTGSSVNKFKSNKKQYKLSSIGKLFIFFSILFLFFIFTSVF
ncbi:hypothetical protein NVI2019_NGLDDFDA_00844 [Providencia alcalifaciens]|nr:hypothetical protein NVI2019_NGLDDFDA_00844 [Providencia alcalifaciens]